MLLAEDAGAVVGYALFFHNYSTFVGKPGIYLEDLFVVPEHRGKGHGKALFHAVANLAVPLSPVGQGGFAQVTAAVNLTVIGAPWTTGTVQIGTVTAMGARNPASSSGAASGTVSLVSPVFVSTNIAPSAVVPVFAIMSMHFVPEPGTLALFGAGLVGLVAHGVRRGRR